MKSSLRKKLLTKRKYIENRLEAERSIVEQVTKTFSFKNDDIIAGYLQIKSEASIAPLFTALHHQKHACCMPIVIEKNTPLSFRLWSPQDNNKTGHYNIPEPPTENEAVTPNILFVPLVGFDRQGNRLGYGGGFYDRTLKMLRQKKDILAIGVGFSSQEVDKLPINKHDEQLDFIATEKEVIKCV